MRINYKTTALEIAAVVSQTLEAAGILATLSGGGAVNTHTENEYQSTDLDFVTSERRDTLAEALAPIGFTLASDRRHFEHANTKFYLEFPPAPLEFGSRIVQHNDIPRLDTPWGPLRVITPTLCVMDRLIAYWAWSDRQSWDQAVMVCRHSANIDFSELVDYANAELADPADIDRLRKEAEVVSPSDI